MRLWVALHQTITCSGFPLANKQKHKHTHIQLFDFQSSMPAFAKLASSWESPSLVHTDHSSGEPTSSELGAQESPPERWMLNLKLNWRKGLPNLLGNMRMPQGQCNTSCHNTSNINIANISQIQPSIQQTCALRGIRWSTTAHCQVSKFVQACPEEAYKISRGETDTPIRNTKSPPKTVQKLSPQSLASC